ncbi:MAG: DUF1549 domain-containing protein [bacterium]|nr:DUF1549 domain-containing protein [bacterium]
MPAEGRPLNARELADLERWIADGAHWPGDVVLGDPARWWAFQALTAEPLTSSAAIDTLVRARHTERGLSPSPPAPPRSLVRRLYFDLLGLPPPPAVASAFEADPSDAAFDALVEELLAPGWRVAVCAVARPTVQRTSGRSAQSRTRLTSTTCTRRSCTCSGSTMSG